MPRPDPKAVFILRLALVSLILFGPGTWFIATERARFTLGGDENKSAAEDRHAIRVDAEGGAAIRIGLAFYGVGLLAMAEVAPRRARIPVFALGAALAIGCLVWWTASCIGGS